MAGVRIRRRARVRLGRLHVMLAADRYVYVRWTTFDQASEDLDTGLSRVAAVACVEWAVRMTLTDHGWSRRQVTGHLERACRTASAPDYNARNGTLAVVQSAPPVGTPGPSIQVEATLETVSTGERRIVLEWSVPPGFRSVADSERLVAALWGLATEGEHGDSVHHALRALRGGYERSGGFDPSAADDLVASLLEFGDDLTASERRAREWRSQLRVV